ncbi:MAG: hypothetical protein ACRDRD_18400, partial [Pseudonocardiaceae bacterium]
MTISGLGPAGYTVDATNVNSTGNAVNGQNGYQVVSAQASFDFAGTLSGAHAWVASVATFKPVPPSPLSGQTPVARAPYNPAGQSPDDLNQLLGTHSTVSCWDNATAIASPSVVQFGGFQPLASASGPVAVSQGVSVAGGTIDRVVLPLSIASGIGADVTVGLYADSGGSPAGPPIAQVLVPREALAVPAPVAASQGGPAAFGAQLMTSWRQQSVFVAAGTPSLTAVGTTLIALGGDLAGVKVATVYTATAADQSVGPWAVAPVLPDVRQFAGTCCTPHYVVVTGGIDNTVYHNTVWTASVDANGNLGAWTVQTALPVPLALHAAVYSNGWVYLIGGYTTGTVAQATVYAGAIDANGQVLGWNALGGLPVAMGAPAAGIVNGHLVVVAGGNTSGGTPAAWLAPVLAPGQLGAFRPIAAPPTWIADPTSTVVGDTLFVGGGTAGVMYSLQVSPTGDVGPWITQPAISPAPSAISVMASLGSTVYLIGTPGANVLTADSNRVPTISVPLHATGLAAATYDIVVSLAGPNDPNNSPQVGLSSGASSLPFAESKAGTAAWVGANDQLPANESGTSITTGWGDSTANATVAYAGGAIVLTSLAAGTMECAHFLAVTPNTDYTLQASAEASATGRSCQLNIIWYDAN